MYEYLDKRYALAYYELAEEKKSVEKYLQDLRDVVELISTNSDIMHIIEHPQISRTNKKKMFNDIFTGKVNDDLVAFLKILIDKDRMETIKGILDKVEAINLERNNILLAKVKTVIPLTEEEKDMLKNKLSSLYKKGIKIEEDIDKSIIGGVYVRVGNDVIDGTLKNKLESMKKTMLNANLDVLKE